MSLLWDVGVCFGLFVVCDLIKLVSWLVVWVNSVVLFVSYGMNCVCVLVSLILIIYCDSMGPDLLVVFSWFVCSFGFLVGWVVWCLRLVGYFVVHWCCWILFGLVVLYCCFWLWDFANSVVLILVVLCLELYWFVWLMVLCLMLLCFEVSFDLCLFDCLLYWFAFGVFCVGYYGCLFLFTVLVCLFVMLVGFVYVCLLWLL